MTNLATSTSAVAGLRTASLLVALVLTGLGAGVYFAFSVGVMPGLARADDRSFVSAMAGMNVAILNGWFLLVFLGAFGATAVATLLHGTGPTLVPLVISCAASLIVLVVTVVVHVPLNEALVAGATAGADPGPLREAFVDSWQRWNIVRTVCATGAVAAVGWALVSR